MGKLTRMPYCSVTFEASDGSPNNGFWLTISDNEADAEAAAREACARMGVEFVRVVDIKHRVEVEGG